MKLSEIERIAKAAMTACLPVINHPKDSFARETLFNALAEVIDPAFFETDQTRKGPLNDLLQQANVWGAIVRNRIDIFRPAGRGGASALSIRHPTRDLEHVLYSLLDELGGLPPIHSGFPAARRA
jgi:hypothetical protein